MSTTPYTPTDVLLAQVRAELAAERAPRPRSATKTPEPTTDTPTRFGVTLRRCRERANISQTKLARRAGYDHSHVGRMESGDRAPSRPTVETLADALDLPPTARATLLASAGFLPDELAALTDAQLALVVATAREMTRC